MRAQIYLARWTNSVRFDSVFALGGAPVTTSQHQQEIDRNFDFLQRNLARLLPAHEGQYALLKSGKIEAFFDRPGDAYREGLDRFEDGVFSIQEVTGKPLDLGFFSYAGT